MNKILTWVMEFMTKKPRIAILILVAIYLVTIKWWGADASVPVVMTIAFAAVVMITWKNRVK